jgi:hypothetical protein
MHSRKYAYVHGHGLQELKYSVLILQNSSNCCYYADFEGVQLNHGKMKNLPQKNFEAGFC